MSAIDNSDCIRVHMPFNSLTAEFFEDNDHDELVGNMFAHRNTQVENSRISETDLQEIESCTHASTFIS